MSWKSTIWVKLELQDPICRLRFYWNLLTQISSLWNSHRFVRLKKIQTSKANSKRYSTSFYSSLRAIFCKIHPTCDSRVFRISSYFSQLKIKVILEHGRNFTSIKHFVEFLGGSRDNSSFSRNAISVHKLYFESPLSLLELLFRVQITSTWTLLGSEHN